MAGMAGMADLHAVGAEHPTPYDVSNSSTASSLSGNIANNMTSNISNISSSTIETKQGVELMELKSGCVQDCTVSFQQATSGYLNGYINYVDRRKQRKILFCENDSKVLFHTCTSEEHDVVMAAKAVQWCFLNLMTWAPNNAHVAKYVSQAYSSGKVTLFLTCAFKVPDVLIASLASKPAFPIHIIEWKPRSDPYAADALRRTIDSLPQRRPTQVEIEMCVEKARAPPEQWIRVNNALFKSIQRSYDKTSAEKRGEWRYCHGQQGLGITGDVMTVMHDGREFIDPITCCPVVADVSLDSLENVLYDAGQGANKLKMSELMRRRRLNKTV